MDEEETVSRIREFVEQKVDGKLHELVDHSDIPDVVMNVDGRIMLFDFKTATQNREQTNQQFEFYKRLVEDMIGRTLFEYIQDHRYGKTWRCEGMGV